MKIPTSVFALFLTAVAFQQTASGETTQTGTLTVVVTGLPSDNGGVAYALFGSKKSYKKKRDAAGGGFTPVESRSSKWIVEDLPYGDYVVLVYHDENGNEKLDTNVIGIPKEPYGFSNNAVARFGPPSFDKAKVSLSGPELTIEIRVTT